MHEELSTDLQLDVAVLAVNGAGYEAGNEIASTVAELPILQDIEEVDAWGLWMVTYRDVFILDADNNYVGTYNLTENSLLIQENYDALRDMIVAAGE